MITAKCQLAYILTSYVFEKIHKIICLSYKWLLVLATIVSILLDAVFSIFLKVKDL